MLTNYERNVATRLQSKKKLQESDASKEDGLTNSFDQDELEQMLQEAYIEPNPDGSPIPFESLTSTQQEFVMTGEVINKRIAELTQMTKELIMIQARTVVRRFYPDPTFIEISVSVAPSFEEDTVQYTLEIRNTDDREGKDNPIKSGIAEPIKLLLMKYEITFNDLAHTENISERWIRFFMNDSTDKMLDFVSRFDIEEGSLADIGVQIMPPANSDQFHIGAYDDNFNGYGDYDGYEDEDLL